MKTLAAASNRQPKSATTNFMYYIKLNIKLFVHLFVFYAVSTAHAGSYEDFFGAIPKDDATTVAALLNRGFDGNTRDPKGQHALHLAVRANASKVVNTLLGWKRIDVEPRNAVDESPMMLAALDGHTDIVRRLVEAGADVNKTGWTPLHYAATNSHLEIMRLLLDRHAYIDAASPNGTTPLMMAAFYGSPSAVKLLLEYGADPTLQNKQAMSAIDFAHKANRADSADLIAAFVRARQPKGKW